MLDFLHLMHITKKHLLRKAVFRNVIFLILTRETITWNCSWWMMTETKNFVLGAKAMNLLTTSSIHIDSNDKPDIGPSSSNRFLPSREARLFIERAKVDSCQVLFYPSDEFAQLRQLRFKFDKLSTYLCYRFASKFTNGCRTRLLAIWTLADCSRRY